MQKCEFAKAKVVYLGNSVDYGKVIPKQSNVQAILKFPTLRSFKNISSFLGLSGYYRKFVKIFSDIVNLTTLLKKGVEFVWSPDCKNAFQDIKHTLTSFPFLRTPDFTKPFSLATKVI